jgi:5-(carboxyamino)imidazole ribonucleotide synthase
MVHIGVIGGGQLARMMIPAAINLGFELSVFAEGAESAAGLAVRTIGDYSNLDEILKFARDVDVLTFDHEHVPTGILLAVESAGIKVYPPPRALELTHDKSVMRARLDDLDVPQPRWVVVDDDQVSKEQITAVGGYPCVAKKPVGGYDGKGVRVVSSRLEFADWLSEGPVLLEEKIDFVRELAQLSARNPSGQWEAWDIVETVQRDGVCAEVFAPAPNLGKGVARDALELSRHIAQKLGVVGVLAVELFEAENGRLLVNELAMRPHNSGHVFSELSVTSQFEQHLRAVANFPLGSGKKLAPCAVMINLFGSVDGSRVHEAYSHNKELKVHDYRKAHRTGRKAGHLVLVGEKHSEILAQSRDAAATIQGSDYDE